MAPTEERCDGTGLLFAEAAKGISNGLNSKADQLLQLLLHKQLVSASELNVSHLPIPLVKGLAPGTFRRFLLWQQLFTFFANGQGFDAKAEEKTLPKGFGD